MPSYLADDLQLLAANRARRQDKTVDELVGLCKGMAADGEVNAAECDFMVQWLTRNAEFANTWPIDVLNRRIQLFLEDGRIDREERDELLALMNDITGGKPIAPQLDTQVTSLPFDDPAPAINLRASFCFTGEFVFGKRKDCMEEAKMHGGKAAKSLNQSVNYLVVGLVGCKSWAHDSWGRKIETAVRYRDDLGLPIAIVTEDHWASFLL